MKAKKQILFIVVIAIFLAALIVRYRPTIQPTQPVPKTPSITPVSETSLTGHTPTPSALNTQAADSDTPTPVSQKTPTSEFLPGTVLTNQDRNRIFYITADGTARRIESWMDFYALGFQREAVLTVDDATLNYTSISGHLTRHLYDDDYHYWAADGFLWAIDAWQRALTTPAYRGVPPTPADPLLLAGMPVVTTIPDDILMRDGVKLYVKQGGFVYPVVSSSVYQAFGYNFNRAVEIPHGVMAKHDHKQPLTRFLRNESKIYEIVDGQRRPITVEKLVDSGYSENDLQTVPPDFLRTFPLVDDSVTLRVRAPVVNLRWGPGTGYKVVEQVSADEKLISLGRTQDNSWFKVRYRGERAWIAASVVDLMGDLENLPKIEATIVYATPSPTPKPTSTPLRPLACNQLPIRGFGKVWADHTEVQHGLKCPSRNERGIETAVQQFQHGFMIWVEQDGIGGDSVYAFFAESAYQRFSHTRPADPAAAGPIPSGFYSVGDKFGSIYWQETGARVKERLGYATTPQLDSPGAFQQFSSGRMFWFGTIDRIFVVYDYPSGWDSFEDKFN